MSVDSVPRRSPTQAGALSLALALLGGACAPVSTPPAVPEPGDLARLEAELTRDSASVEALVALGVAYRAANRPAEARPLLERAFRSAPEHAAASFFLGLTYEELGLLAEAREQYARYLRVGRSRELRGHVQRRLPLLEHRALRIAVRDALAREAQLAATPPSDRHVAVFPFVVSSTDPEMTPLGRALSEMLVTDLSRTDRLTVLERAHAQALLDEMALGASGRVEASTAARGGRLIGAGRVVQGSVSEAEQRLELQAAVVRVGEADRLRPVSEEDALERLFDAQKRLALALYGSLGVQLSDAERELVLQRPTGSLRALVEFGRALEAEDAGDFGRASGLYTAAVALDPGFAAAAGAARRTADMAAALQVSTGELAVLGRQEEAGTVRATDLDPALRNLVDAGPNLGGLTDILVLVPNFGERDPVAEVVGTEGLGRGGEIEIIVRQP